MRVSGCTEVSDINPDRSAALLNGRFRGETQAGKETVSVPMAKSCHPSTYPGIMPRHLPMSSRPRFIGSIVPLRLPLAQSGLRFRPLWSRLVRGHHVLYMHIVPLSADIDPTLAIRDADIKRAFTAQTLSAGRSYEQRGRVQELQISSAGAVISALTQGTQPDPYVQNLRVVRLPSGGVKIVGACSCPMRAQCKHVAAVAIAAQRRESVLAKSAAALSSPKRMLRAAAEPQAPKPAAKSLLPVQIRDWLSDFDGEDDELTEDYPPSIRTRVYYVLGSEPAHLNGAGVPRLLIDPMTVTLRKDGSAGSIRRYAPHQVQTPAKYLRPSDLVILSRLARRASGLLARADDDPVDTLRRILATGRARWGNAEGPTVTEGAERQGQITWITRPDASQQASLSVDEGLTAVRLPQPWYVDTTAGTIGPIGFDLPAKVVRRLLDAPPIPPEAAGEVRAQLASRMPAAKLPVPSELQPAETVQETMRPHLRLISGTLPMDPNYGRGSARPLARRALCRAARAPVLRLRRHHPAAQRPAAAEADGT